MMYKTFKIVKKKNMYELTMTKEHIQYMGLIGEYVKIAYTTRSQCLSTIDRYLLNNKQLYDFVYKDDIKKMLG